MATLLEAAASVISDSGYETATMSEIAERAGACIGSLYQFFPNKEAIAQALWSQYGREIAELWAPLEQQTKFFTAEELAFRLVGDMVAFIEDRPAFLPLLEAPATTCDPSIRQCLREQVARCLAIMRPRLSSGKAMRMSILTLQLLKALNELYTEASTAAEKRAFVQEFRFALTSYLTSRLEPAAHSFRRLKN